MKLLELIKREARKSRWKILFVIAVSCFYNIFILYTINYSSQHIPENGQINVRSFFLCLIAILLYAYSQNYLSNQVIQKFERVLKQIRIRIGEKIRNSELFTLEKIGKEKLYSVFTQGTSIISESGSSLVLAMNSFFLLIFTLLYIAYTFAPVLIFVFLIIGGSTSFYFYRSISQRAIIMESKDKVIEFTEVVSSQLYGFKEIKINQKRSNSLVNHLKEVSNSLFKVMVRILEQDSFDYILLGQCSYYVTLFAIIFWIPPTFPSNDISLSQITQAVLFLQGPVFSLSFSIPMLFKANLALESIDTLEKKLDEYQLEEKSENLDPTILPLEFTQEIRFHDVYFFYKNDKKKIQFSVGPLDFHFQKGKIAIVVGSNGSGKSTVMKLLSHLYYPDTGKIMIDGVEVTFENSQRYRELFSLIFSDFHLFSRLYGLPEIEPEKVNELLELLKLEGKTEYREGKFTTTSLSKGQRKRLALLVALLEDRPIYIFDEWTADQDPEFRKFFYETLLPELKRKGKTIIAVSHDDRYFHIADHLIKMDQGKVSLQEKREVE